MKRYMRGDGHDVYEVNEEDAEIVSMGDLRHSKNVRLADYAMKIMMEQMK